MNKLWWFAVSTVLFLSFLSSYLPTLFVSSLPLIPPAIFLQGPGNVVDLDVDSSGHVYIAGSVACLKYDSQGNALSIFFDPASSSSNPSLFSSGALTLDPSQQFVYFADAVQRRVLKFDTNAKFLASFSVPTPLPLILSGSSYFFSIRIDSQQNIYLSDKWNSCIIKLGSDGSWLGQYNVSSSSTPKLSFQPNTTSLFFIQYYPEAIIELTNSLQYVATFTISSSYFPLQGLQVEANGDFLFLYGGDLARYTRTTGSIHILIGDSSLSNYPFLPLGIAIWNLVAIRSVVNSGTGIETIWLANQHSNAIWQCSSTGGIIQWWYVPLTPRQLNFVNSSNTLLYTDHSLDTVFQYQAYGNRSFISSFRGASYSGFYHGLLIPQAAQSDGNGGGYTIDINNQIIHFTWTGTATVISGSLVNPSFLFFNRELSLLYAPTNNNQIQVWNTITNSLSSTITSSSPATQQLTGLGVTAQGVIYVADTHNSRILRVLASGTVDTTFTTPASWGLNGPLDVAVTSDSSSLFIADGNPRVLQVSLSGAILRILTLNNPSLYPSSVALDSNDNLYVADQNDRILFYNFNALTPSVPTSLSSALYASSQHHPLIETSSSHSFFAQTATTSTLSNSVCISNNSTNNSSDSFNQTFSSSGSFCGQPNQSPVQSSTSSSISAGVVAGATVGCIAGILILLTMIYLCYCYNNRQKYSTSPTPIASSTTAARGNELSNVSTTEAAVQVEILTIPTATTLPALPPRPSSK